MVFMNNNGETEQFNKIFLFAIITLIQVVVFGIAVHRIPKNSNLEICFAALLTVILEFGYLGNGIIRQNHLQLINFPAISILTLTFASLSLKKASGVSLYLIILFMFLIILNMIISVIFGLQYKKLYQYKLNQRFGNNIELQNIYTARRMLIVFFKLDTIESITSFNVFTPKNNYGLVIFILKLIIFFITIFLFIVYSNSENRSARYSLIITYFIKIIVNICDIIQFIFRKNFSSLFTLISNGYTIFNDICLIIFMVIDYMNFGKGLQIASKKNREMMDKPCV